MDPVTTPTTAVTLLQDTPAQVGMGNTIAPVKRKGNPFKPGHPRFGGRKKGAPMKRTAEAREIAEKLGFHPVEWLVRVAAEGVMLNPDGTQTVCDTAQRLDAAKAVSQYLVPKLMATQVTGRDEGPIAVAALDMNKLLMDPDAVEAAQKLALLMAKPDVEGLPEAEDE